MRGLIACTLKGEPGETYNIASGVESTILELTQLVKRLAGNTMPIALKWRATGIARDDTSAIRPRPTRSLDFPPKSSLNNDRVSQSRYDLALHHAARAFCADGRPLRMPDGVVIRRPVGALVRFTQCLLPSPALVSRSR